MRRVYSSPRAENVDRVETLLNQAGIATRVIHRDKLDRGRFRRFSYHDPGNSAEWPAVLVVSAEDMPKARELLRAAGLIGSTRPGVETPIPHWEAPGNGPDVVAMRMRRVAMIAVLVALVVLAWVYQNVSSRTDPITMRPSAPTTTEPTAPVVEDDTVLLLDDRNTESKEER